MERDPLYLLKQMGWENLGAHEVVVVPTYALSYTNPQVIDLRRYGLFPVDQIDEEWRIYLRDRLSPVQFVDDYLVQIPDVGSRGDLPTRGTRGMVMLVPRNTGTGWGRPFSGPLNVEHALAVYGSNPFVYKVLMHEGEVGVYFRADTDDEELIEVARRLRRGEWAVPELMEEAWHNAQLGPLREFKREVLLGATSYISASMARELGRLWAPEESRFLLNLAERAGLMWAESPRSPPGQAEPGLILRASHEMVQKLRMSIFQRFNEAMMAASQTVDPAMLVDPGGDGNWLERLSELHAAELAQLLQLSAADADTVSAVVDALWEEGFQPELVEEPAEGGKARRDDVGRAMESLRDPNVEARYDQLVNRLMFIAQQVQWARVEWSTYGWDREDESVVRTEAERRAVEKDVEESLRGLSKIARAYDLESAKGLSLRAGNRVARRDSDVYIDLVFDRKKGTVRGSS
jgi:hypothetical protein